MLRPIENLRVTSSDSIRRAMQMLNETGVSILLQVGTDGRLTRTVTDGDLRRLLIGGANLDSLLSVLPSSAPTTIENWCDSTRAFALMNEYAIDQLPVVDSDGKPTGLYLRRDLDKEILLSTPHMGDEEMGFINSAFKTNWIAPLGPNVDAFEEEMAKHVEIGHAAAVTSGTAAIHLALRVLGVGAGDIVFCSTLTFVATANPILYQGAVPVFIDSETDTWNMSVEALESAFVYSLGQGKMPKAVIVVNLYGQSADMDPIMNLCREYNVPVIEDAAESLGATYKGRASGTIGTIGVYSFNGNKIITTSGGGMIISRDGSLIEKARFLATQARDPAPFYQHSEMGFNYRMSNILAGIGRGQLRVLESRVKRRREIFARYQEQLRSIHALSWMPEQHGVSTRWLSVCLLDSKSSRRPVELINHLSSEKIEARRVWKPMHLQPLFEGYRFFSHNPESSVAEDLFNRGICLPSGSNLSDEQLDRIIRCIHHALN